jgi:hypothetical protein
VIFVGSAAVVLVGAAVTVFLQARTADAPGSLASPTAPVAPSVTSSARSSPSTSTSASTELPPLLGAAKRSAFFTDASIAGIDLGAPIDPGPDLDFPVYALTDPVRAAIGPGWSLWLAEDLADTDGEALHPAAILVSSPGGTVFLRTRLDPTNPDQDWFWDATVWSWFPSAHQAFAYDGGEDSTSSSLIDLDTGSRIQIAPDPGGTASHIWERAATRPDGSEVWYQSGFDDNGYPEWLNLDALYLRSTSGVWSPIPSDYTNLLTSVVMDATGRFALIERLPHRIVSEDSVDIPDLPNVAVIDTSTGSRTDYAPRWPDGVDGCRVDARVDSESFLGSCFTTSDASGPGGQWRVFLDGTTRPVAQPQTDTWDRGWRTDDNGLVAVAVPSGNGLISEIGLSVPGGRISVLDLATLASAPGLESAASGATGFSVDSSTRVGSSLVIASGSVGTEGFCLAVDTAARTFDVERIPPGVSGLKCGDWGSAPYVEH